MKMAARLNSVFCAGVMLAACLLTDAAYGQKIPKARADWWRTNAPTCTAPDGFVFVSKRVGSECDDGDTTLFAGLLCAAGEPLGCATVKRAQADSGKWFRSPWRAQTDNLGKKNSFSPDMALGAQLYVTTTKDVESLKRWHKWLDDVRACWVGSGDNCMRSPFLRYCTDDTEKGCALRPVDLAVLGATSTGMKAFPPTEDVRRLLLQAGTNMYDLIWADSQFNEPGFSQHLVGVEIFLLRLLGHKDQRLQGAAVALSGKQPKNPFFLFLAEGPTRKVADLTMTLCPSPETGVPTSMNEWSWERKDEAEAWKRSMIWECVFMAKLLGTSP
jgi:hypothetical protein